MDRSFTTSVMGRPTHSYIEKGVLPKLLEQADSADVSEFNDKVLKKKTQCHLAASPD